MNRPYSRLRDAFSDNMEELAGVRETRQPQGDASDDRSH